MQRPSYFSGIIHYICSLTLLICKTFRLQNNIFHIFALSIFLGAEIVEITKFRADD